MSGLKELLNDRKYGDYNKIWDIISILEESYKDFEAFKDSKIDALIYIARVASKMSNALHHLETIPDKLREVVLELERKKKEGKLDEEVLLNNIAEIQRYRQFVEEFNKIGDRLASLLSAIKRNEDAAEAAAKAGYQNMYDDILGKSAKAQLKFKEVDNDLMEILRSHLLSVVEKVTEKVMENYTKDRKGRISKSETERVRMKLTKELYENITNKETLGYIMSGQLPPIRELTRSDGKKVKLDLEKIKDVSKWDYFIFLIGPTSTMSDPFVTSALALYMDRVMQAHTVAMEEQMTLTKKIFPLFKKAVDKYGYYEAQKMLQSVQNTFDKNGEKNVFERRSYLSETRRADAAFELETFNNQLSNIKIKQRDLQNIKLELENKIKEDPSTQDVNEKLITENEKITKELNEKKEKIKEEKEKFVKEEFIREFSDGFYEIRDKFIGVQTDPATGEKVKENVSNIWKELKALNKQIGELEFSKAQLQTMGQDPFELIGFHEDLGRLYTQRDKLKRELPDKEKQNTKNILDYLKSIRLIPIDM